MFKIDCREVSSYGDFVDVFTKYLNDFCAVTWDGDIASLNGCLLCAEKEKLDLTILGSDHCKDVLASVKSIGSGKAVWSHLTEIFHENREWMAVKME